MIDYKETGLNNSLLQNVKVAPLYFQGSSAHSCKGNYVSLGKVVKEVAIKDVSL